MTAREGNMGNCHPKKTNVDKGEAEVDSGFARGDSFPCYPLVQSIFIILYSLGLVSKQSRSSEYWRLYFLLRKCKRSYYSSQNLWWTANAYILRSRYFLEYHPSSSSITRCQVPSRVRMWFHDSMGDIDFNQMFLSQSESTILHECIILYFSSSYIKYTIQLLFTHLSCKIVVLWKKCCWHQSVNKFFSKELQVCSYTRLYILQDSLIHSLHVND